MKIIVRPRQGGKTRELIRWVKEGKPTGSYPFWSRIILCHTFDEAQRLRTEGSLEYRQVFSVREWRQSHIGPDPMEIAVDNVDLVLMDYLGMMPSHITLNGEGAELL